MPTHLDGVKGVAHQQLRDARSRAGTQVDRERSCRLVLVLLVLHGCMGAHAWLLLLLLGA
jgi:hypothetical protein